MKTIEKFPYRAEQQDDGWWHIVDLRNGVTVGVARPGIAWARHELKQWQAAKLSSSISSSQGGR
jgi:hypothetical protein